MKTKPKDPFSGTENARMSAPFYFSIWKIVQIEDNFELSSPSKLKGDLVIQVLGCIVSL